MEKIHFKVEGRLAQLLGRQSMLNEVMAIFELCKNGYDADTEDVEIYFENILSGNSQIRIVDFGHGMTESDIKEKFMVVATTSRTGKKTSPKGRPFVGEKGIGRFAMDKLSHKTTIYSYPENESKGYKIVIDWDRFDVEGASFTDIGNSFEEFDKDPKKKGVEIISENLRDKWDEAKIKKLDRQLQKIVPPEKIEIKLPFAITLHAEEYGIVGKSVKSEYLKKAPYHLIGTLHNDGRITISIYKKGKRIIGSGIDHKRCNDGKVSDNPGRCGPTKYEMWGYPFDKPGETIWTKVYGTRFEPLIKDWIHEVQGIRIYLDCH